MKKLNIRDTIEKIRKFDDWFSTCIIDTIVLKKGTAAVLRPHAERAGPNVGIFLGPIQDKRYILDQRDSRRLVKSVAEFIAVLLELDNDWDTEIDYCIYASSERIYACSESVPSGLGL